jgi:hypothetical protein
MLGRIGNGMANKEGAMLSYSDSAAILTDRARVVK